MKKAVRGADPKALKWVVEYARRKCAGEVMSVEDEERFAKVEFDDGGMG